MPLLATRGAASARGFGLFGNRPVATDPYFNYVTALLHGDGTNGGQNNTFLDSSSNNFTITRNGNTTQGSYSPYGSLWSNYFDGSGDYLSVASSASFALSGDFTVECWAFPGTQTQRFPSLIGFPTPDIYLQYSHEDAPGKFSIVVAGTRLAPSSTQSANAWYHVAAVRSGSTITLYINGTSVATATISTSFGNSSVVIGGNDAVSASLAYIGYISNARIVKGTAVYTSAFTPSTTPLTAISGTSLLTCQSNRFIDNSSNNFAITRNGDTRVTNFSPFLPTAAYSTATNGGSGYFDGSGDYLNGPSTGQFAPTGDFTISMWFYPTSFAASYYVLAGTWAGSGASDEWLIQYDNTGAIRFLTTTNTSFSSSGVVKLNQWNFLSVSRSGTTVTGYVNGTSFSSYTLTGTVGSATKTVYIGIQAGTTWPYVGWISDFRLVAGSAQSATPPTSPATAISGTNMLLNFTNGSIVDNSMLNDLETVGNAQISTSVKKYGTGSYYIGTASGTSFLRIPATPNLIFGTGDFTVEGWFQPSASGNERTFYIHGFNSTGGISFFVGTGGTRFRSAGTNDLSDTTAISSSAFTHIAFVRSGNTRRIFVNGTQVVSDTLSFDANENAVTDIGASDQNASDAFRYYGYIDDLRITKGVARYTANFTPPTAAFPNQ